MYLTGPQRENHNAVAFSSTYSFLIYLVIHEFVSMLNLTGIPPLGCYRASLSISSLFFSKTLLGREKSLFLVHRIMDGLGRQSSSNAVWL